MAGWRRQRDNPQSEKAAGSEMKSLFSFLILTAACGIADAPCKALAFEFAQGVIVDAMHSVVYMVNSEAGIDAVTLSNGEVIATSARGAKPLAEIVGFGMSADACHVTQPSAEGAARAIRAAMRDGGLAPEQVGYINAHGSGTLINDPLETRAIRELFGTHANRLAVSSTKSLHGHALGATGAMEAVCTVLALQNRLLPPTANFTESDPDCNLDVVPNHARPADVEFALSNSFAFGGLNAVLAFRGPNP